MPFNPACSTNDFRTSYYTCKTWRPQRRTGAMCSSRPPEARKHPRHDAEGRPGGRRPGKKPGRNPPGRGSTHEYDPRAARSVQRNHFWRDATFPLTISAPPQARRTFPFRTHEQLDFRRFSPTRVRAGATLAIEFQHRIAFPAACLVFALLGVPIGVRPRRGGRAGGIDPDARSDRRLLFHLRYRRITWRARDRSLPGAGFGRPTLLRLLRVSSSFGASKRFADPAASWRGSDLWRRALASGASPRGDAVPISGIEWQAPRGGARWTTAGRSRLNHSGLREGTLAFPMLFDVYLLQHFFYYFSGAAGGVRSHLRCFHTIRPSRRYLEKPHRVSRWCSTIFDTWCR